jgi:hypothetical protein
MMCPQLTTAWLIDGVCVSALKIFHPPSDVAGIYAGIFVHTMKLLIDDSCQVPLFHKKFNVSMLMKPYVGDSLFIAVHDGNIRGVHVLILHSCWRGKMLLMVL